MSQEEDNRELATTVTDTELQDDNKLVGATKQESFCQDSDSQICLVKPVVTGTEYLEAAYSDVTGTSQKGDASDVVTKSPFLDKINENIRDSYLSEDNLSLEVNFGDSGSCRASDVSSISFQNIVLDDPDFDFEPYHTNQLDPSVRDSRSESSDSPLHDFPGEDDESLCKNNFAEEIKLREHLASERKIKSNCVGGDGCCSDDEIGCDYNDKALTYFPVKSDAESSYLDISDSSLAAYFAKANPLLSSFNTLSSSNTGGGLAFPHTNTKPFCTDGARLHGSFQESEGTPGDLSASVPLDVKVDSTNSSDQQSIDSSDVTVNDKPDSGSDKDSQRSSDLVKERNGLEIRNNVRDLKQVRKVDSVLCEPSREGNHVTKIHRQSPGLAHRLPKDPDSSSSERELDTSEIDTSIKSELSHGESIKSSKKSSSNGHCGLAIERRLKQSIVDNLKNVSPNKEPMDHEQIECVSDSFVNFENVLNNFVPVEDGKDVENEYDYVKYARIQDGDSYVGMRLAYSTTNESGNIDIADTNRPEESFMDRSQNNSPDKLSHQQQKSNHLVQPVRVSNVNEETLTEIPLNGNDHLGVDEPNNFSLSPELTECDSAEVESVISDEEKSTPSGMPNVEDGLSSSAGSDVDEMSTNANNKCPSELLKRKYKNDIEQELHQKLQEKEVQEFFSPVVKNEEDMEEPSPEHQEAIRRKKEALDLAIKV